MSFKYSGILYSLGIIVSFNWIFLETDAFPGNEIIASNYKKIENPCLCKEFRCSVGGFCLASERVCNGLVDCPNKEDEFDCLDDENETRRRRMRTKKKVNNNDIGDDGNGNYKSTMDSSNSISNNSSGTGSVGKCDQGQYRCKFGGACINITLVCDGIIHCRGATEEASDFCDYVYGVK